MTPLVDSLGCNEGPKTGKTLIAAWESDHVEPHGNAFGISIGDIDPAQGEMIYRSMENLKIRGGSILTAIVALTQHGYCCMLPG